MKKKIVGKLFVGLAAFLGMSAIALSDSSDVEAAILYRAYNPNTGEHLYTANASEVPSIVKHGWRNEGTAWEAPDSGANVYRMFNPNNGGDHHYTLNQGEVNNLKKHGWKYEGISWKSGGSTPVYRLYNPNAKSGTHHFTTLASEKNHLVKVGWRYEGVAFYSGKSNSGGSTGGTPAPAPFDAAKVEKQMSQKLFSLINQHRSSIGIRKLDGSDILNKAVAMRAEDLYTLYDHRRPDGTDISTFVNKQLGYNKYGSCGGENIWGGTYKTDKDNPDAVASLIFNGWKGSSGHRKLMESAIANEGAVGIKLKHRGTTYYDVSVVLLTGMNSSK